MKITDVPFAVLRFQYQLARVPLQLIEDQVVARMGAESPARLMYERSVGKLDVAVGTALDAPDVQRRGTALVERSEALSRAARLDTAADRAIEQADEDLQDARDTATAVRQVAGAEKEDEVTEARANAAHQKVAAIQDAEKRVVEVTKQADDAAAKRKDAVEAAKRGKQDKVRAAERSAAAIADAKTIAARKKRSAAAAKRGQADRVEQLADARKQRREPASDQSDN
jgi:hypothetical protein